jgi:hypothetical protein
VYVGEDIMAVEKNPFDKKEETTNVVLETNLFNLSTIRRG